MKVDRLSPELLRGKYLHCRPVEGKPIVEAEIRPNNLREMAPMFEVIILCPARDPASKCWLRKRAGCSDTRCHYYKGDSKGVYQILGPGMGEEPPDGGFRYEVKKQ